MQGDICFYCPTSLDGAGHADHFVPLARGGGNNPENIVLGCPPCNLSKGSKDPLQWLAERDISGIVVEVRDGITVPLHAVAGRADDPRTLTMPCKVVPDERKDGGQRS